MSAKRKVVIITGATGTGKSAVAIEVAKSIDGEIISADSMQVYIGMDIGTAKIKKSEMQGTHHHMIDIVLPDENFSVSEFKTRAVKLINDIHARGKTPIVCGGTGLYINALTYNLDFAKKVDTSIREELKKERELFGLESMYEKLMQVSPDDALRIHPNDEKRILRKLELIKSGNNTSDYNFFCENDDYVYKIIGLSLPREVLYERLNLRVDEMLKAGLEKEVASLCEKYGQAHTAFQGIGYKEIIEYLNNHIDFKTAVENLKRGTRRFAKRQNTWFKRDKRIFWVNILDYSCFRQMIDVIIEYID